MSRNGAGATGEGAPIVLAEVPPFPTGQSEAAILARMRAAAVAMRPGLDVSDGSDYGVLLQIYAGEVARAADDTRTALDLGFAQTTSDGWLDALGQEYGLPRLAAVAATGSVRFTGSVGTAIAAGTGVATAQVGSVPAQTYTTNAAATVVDQGGGPGAPGWVDVPVTAAVAGAAGNAAAGAVFTPLTPLPGITAIGNVLPITGGLDAERDDDYRERLLLAAGQDVRGGTPDDYVRWAREVAGVGGAACVPIKYGPGTVSVAIVDTDGLPASADLCEDVLWHIAPPWVLPFAAAAAPITLTAGATVVTPPAGALEDQVVDLGASGTGGLRHTGAGAGWPQPGIWTIRLRLQVPDGGGSAALLRAVVWNTTANAPLPTRPGATDDSTRTWTAAQLAAEGALAPGWGTVVITTAAWMGEPVEVRIDRQAADATTRVVVDRLTEQSAFCRDTDSSDPYAPQVLAPAGHQVTVEPATAITVDVAGTLVLGPGAVEGAILDEANARLVAYVKEQALPPSGQSNDIALSQVYDRLLSIDGVADVTGLLLNGAAANVTIDVQEVGVLGAVDLTTAALGGGAAAAVGPSSFRAFRTGSR